MELLNDFANWVGFGTFSGMCMCFMFLALWLLLGIGFYYGNKPPKSK